MSLLEVIVPSGVTERLPFGARDVPIDEFLDDAFRSTPSDFRLGFRVSLWVVMLSPLVMLRRFCLASSLSPEERLRLLDRFGESNIYLVRELPMMFKLVLGFAYCQMPAVQRALGIAPLRRERPLIQTLAKPPEASPMAADVGGPV